MKKLIILLSLYTVWVFWYYESCSTTYGFWSIDTWYGKCACTSWYVWWTDIFWKPYCVSSQSKCTEKYWFMASYDSLSQSCTCWYWYVFWTDILGKEACISQNTYCENKYGYWSKYDVLSESCSCSGWYEFGKNYSNEIQCLSCSEIYGNKSKYSYLKNKCECSDGYSISSTTGKCEESSISAYFLLMEYDDSDNKAIVYSTYTKTTYLLELRFAISLYQAEDFIWKNIVINLDTDWKLNRSDKFILNNETKKTDIVTDILSAEIVDDNYTLKSCEDIYWANSIEAGNWKCTCKGWYEWNTSKNKCVASSETTNPVFTSNTNTLNTTSSNITKYQTAAGLLADKWFIAFRSNPFDYEVLSPILRQEIVGISLKLRWTDLPNDYICKNLFKDVSSWKPNNWACRVAEIALENEIISKENKNFNPQVNVSISEALAMVFNSLNMSYQWFDSSGYLFYPNTQEWQKSVLAFAKSKYLIETTYINPNTPAIRGELFMHILLAYSISSAS